MRSTANNSTANSTTNTAAPHPPTPAALPQAAITRPRRTTATRPRLPHPMAATRNTSNTARHRQAKARVNNTMPRRRHSSTGNPHTANHHTQGVLHRANRHTPAVHRGNTASLNNTNTAPLRHQGSRGMAVRTPSHRRRVNTGARVRVGSMAGRIRIRRRRDSMGARRLGASSTEVRIRIRRQADSSSTSMGGRGSSMVGTKAVSGSEIGGIRC